jgi:hypothetical protein
MDAADLVDLLPLPRNWSSLANCSMLPYFPLLDT